MGAAKGAVEVADRRGNDGRLRVSWHPEKRVVNVSQWRRGICVSSTPVELTDVPALVSLLVGALEEAARTPAAAAGPTDVTGPGLAPESPSVGRALPRRRLLRSARRWIRPPQRAQVIQMKARREDSDI
ncbi:MAG: hypothetical protein J2O47_09990 [Acidimicrobiaceae bacterium]|nr:hypothetical protein [Acidimicrobiaceae bacterium]